MISILTMRKTLAGALACLLTAACSPSPTTPSAPRSAAPMTAGATAIAVSAGGAIPMGGLSVADLASCLRAAADAACFSGARPVVRTGVAGATAPGAPANLTATSSGSSVTLSWGAPSFGDPVTTYVIEAGSASGLADLANFTTNSTATTFSASGVGNGTYSMPS